MAHASVMAVLLVYALVALRVLPVVWSLTAGRRAIFPRRWCVAVACGAALILLPSQLSTANVEVSSLAAALLSGLQEVVTGLCLALGLLMLVEGFRLTGAIVGQLSGIGSSEWLDPTRVVPDLPLERFFRLLTVVGVFAMDGHQELMRLMLESFQRVPLGSRPQAELWLAQLVQLLGESFQFGLRVALPVATLLTAASLVVAIIGRWLPQAGVLNWGVCLNFAVALGALAVAARIWMPMLQEHLRTGIDAWRSAGVF